MKNLFLIWGALLLSNVSLAQQWPKEDIDVFMESCVDEAKSFFTKQGTIMYCECTLEKISALYPNSTDIDDITDEEVNILAEACIISLLETNEAIFLDWNEETKTEFVTGCEEELSDSGLGDKKYCPCALEETMKMYRNPFDALNMTEEETQKIVEKCLGL